MLVVVLAVVVVVVVGAVVVVVVVQVMAIMEYITHSTVYDDPVYIVVVKLAEL